MARAWIGMRPPAVFAALIALVLATMLGGCARYNTFYNAEKAFGDAEHAREERIKAGEDPAKPTSAQAADYRRTLQKCRRLLENYPGHSLSDDTLFLMGKAHHRLQEYNSSIEQLDLLFQNFPANPFVEEALYLQAVNHMFTGNVVRSNSFLEQLRDSYPRSRFQAEALRVRGENAFSLERWEIAAESYSEFVRNYPEDDRIGKVALDLGRAQWQLGDYEGAESSLRTAAEWAGEGEDAFQAGVLRARSLVKLQRTEEAEALLDVLMTEASVYEGEGLVGVARAEGQLATGRTSEAVATLSSMPDEWARGDVGAMRGELLGEQYLKSWELEEAMEQFRFAARGSKVTQNPERMKLLDADLRQYSRAEDRLDSAREDERPELLLIQANILNFTLERPRMALERYLEAADVAEADSLVAVRALYGAARIYREALADPDSAGIYEQRLLDGYPDSPQAVVLRDEEGTDLYAYLLSQERKAALLAAATGGDDAAGAEDVGTVAAEGSRPDPARPSPPTDGRYSRWRWRKLERNRTVGNLAG